MADPLSIAASIAGLASLAGQVFKTVVDYSNSVKDSKVDVTILLTELRILSGMLINLSLLASTLKASNSSSPAISDSQISHLRRIIKNLEVQLLSARNNFESSRFKGLTQSLKWPFSKNEVMKLVEEIRTHKATINLALSVDTLEKLVECFRMQVEMKADIKSTRDAIKVLQEMHSRVEINEERKKTYGYFQKTNPQSHLQTALRLRNNNTGGWFLGNPAVIQWMAEPNGKIWLTGIAGSGKTVLCGSLIDRMLGECKSGTVLAFFFCDHKDPETQNLSNILSSIALQIALQKQEAFARLQQYYDQLHPAAGLPRQAEAERLTEVISDMCRMFQKVFLIVDALDECMNDTRKVTRGIAEAARASPNLSIAIFSRREDDISSELSPEYQQVEIAAQTEDLELYIGAEMMSRPTLCGLDPEESNEIRQTLISKANGMFRWVTCQLDCLEGLGKIGRKDALSELPPTLNESYDRILIKAMSKSGRSIAQDIVRHTLHWVCYDSRDLSIAQLCEALSVTLGIGKGGTSDVQSIDEKEIITYCSSLIRKNLKGNNLELAHFTVEEYLRSIDDSSALKKFKYSKAEAARSLSAASLQFLLSPAFGSRPVAEMSEHQKVLQRGASHPFYSYAALHWPTEPNTHEDATVSKLLKEFVAKRKRPYFQNWLIQVCVELASSKQSVRVWFRSWVTFILRRDLTPLHVAASLCSPWLCNWLLEAGSDANATTVSGLTPLHFALLGHKAFQALNQRSMIVAQDTSTYIFREFDLSADDIEATVKLLLEQDIKLTSVDELSIGSMALEACVRFESASPFLTLLDESPDDCLSQDALEYIAELFQDDDAKITALLHDIIQEVFNLDAAANGHACVSNAVRFLHELVRSDGSWDTYDHSEDVFLPVLIQESDFLTYVRYAAEQNRVEDMIRLIEDPRFEQYSKYTSVEDAYSNNPLWIAAMLDNADVFRTLLEHVSDAHKADALGLTVWHIAAANDATDVLQALLELETDIEAALKAVSKDGCTPFGEAMRSGSEKAANLLIRHCGDDASFFLTETPVLHCAVWMGSQSLFHQLISKGLESTEMGLHDSLPLHMVNNSCSEEFVAELVQRYDINHGSKDGKTWTAFETYVKSMLDANKKLSLSREELASRLKVLAPSTHTVRRKHSDRHLWTLFCEKLGIYGNMECSAAKAKRFYQLVLGFSDAGIIASYEQQHHRSALITLYEELEVLDFEAGSHRWESTFLRRAADVLKPPPTIKDHPSTIMLLNKAVRQNCYKVVRSLVEDGVPVLVPANGVSPIEQACHTGSCRIFVEILQSADLSVINNPGEAGPDVLCRLVAETFDRPGFPGLAQDAMKKIEAALEHGVQADAKATSGSHPGSPAIVIAGIVGRYDLVGLLKAKGADVFARSPDGWDLITLAISYDKIDLLRQLYGEARSSSTYDWQARLSFSWKPDESMEPITLEQCAVLHLAVANKRVEIIDYLFAENLVEDVNVRTAGLHTPLHLASISGTVEVIECLARHGADVNAVNSEQRRPIDMALMNGWHYAVAELRRLGSEDPLDIAEDADEAGDADDSDADDEQDGAEPDEHCEEEQDENSEEEEDEHSEEEEEELEADANDSGYVRPSDKEHPRMSLVMRAKSCPPSEKQGKRKCKKVVRFVAPVHEPGSLAFSVDDSDREEGRDKDTPQRDVVDELEDSMTLPEAVESCIEDDDLDGLKELLVEGCPVDFLMPSCGGCDALTSAVRRSRGDIVSWLLSIGAVPMQAACTKHRGSGTLHLAARRPKLASECLRQLLDKALETGYAWPNDPLCPLHFASLVDDAAVLQVFLDHLDANAEAYCHSFSLLGDASACDKSDMMRTLTGWFTTPSEQPLSSVWDCGPLGATPLHITAYRNDRTKSEALINAGADLNSRNSDGQTPLMVAVIESNDSCEIVQCLLDHGAMIDLLDNEGLSAIMHAARRDFIQIATLLAEKGAALHARASWGENLLHISSTADSLRCFIFFHQQGCNADAATVLGHDILSGFPQNTTPYILNARLAIMPASRVEFGMNILSVTLANSGFSMARRIHRSLPKDGKERRISNLGEKFCFPSPLCAAISLNCMPSLQWLLNEGADTDVEGSQEGTPLMHAFAYDRLEQAQALVRSGARLDYVGKNGIYRSALVAAQRWPHIVRWLLVERFQDQPKLASEACNTGLEAGPRAPIQQYEFCWTGRYIMPPDQSGLERASSLSWLRRQLSGTVVS